jgi:uncharacterized protein (DUF427 family)
MQQAYCKSPLADVKKRPQRRARIRQDERIVAEHPRSFGRGETVYDPWHYVPVLAA